MNKDVMGQVQLILKFVDADSPEALALLNTERENEYKSQIIQKQVKYTIVQSLVEFDLPDLDTVLDMLFTAEKINKNREVGIETFREWILRDIKVPVSDRDLQLFIKANPSLNR